MIPALSSDHGYLPVGRYAATRDEVIDRFVLHEDFDGSSTRQALWDEWELHLMFVEAALGTMPRAWLAGSFVTQKAEPADVDVFYGFPADWYDRLDQQDVDSLADLLEHSWCRSHGMRVDAYAVRLPDSVHFDDLRAGQLSARNIQAFQSLGLYDEIWQRSRSGIAVRRGYLEVQL
ncbi:DUF6932 family protein [Kitasatospora sp. NPDC056783]|uniref:DUF6932 family protein n=1 Tax=Kitasatospora sp. NPDC056783 TaxID=3345943 RepID=UPI00368256DF